MNKQDLIKLYNSVGADFGDINLFGIRKSNTECDSFDDLICINLGEDIFAFNGTTDPGGAVLSEKMANEKGTLLLPSTNMSDNVYHFKIGSHKSKYTALNQAEEFTVVRDLDKNGRLYSGDEIIRLLREGKTYTGYFGINIHRASEFRISESVGNWSWGCQVIQAPQDWKKFIDIIEKYVKDTNKKTFSYVLFDEYFVQEQIGLNIHNIKVELQG